MQEICQYNMRGNAKLGGVGKRSERILAESPVRRRVETVLRWSGIKQAELARKLAESEDWVSRRIRGETPFLADELERFAEALRVDPCAFVHDDQLQRLIGHYPPSGEQAPPSDSQKARAQRLTGRILRELDTVPEQDLELFFDFLAWRRERQGQER